MFNFGSRNLELREEDSDHVSPNRYPCSIDRIAAIRNWRIAEVKRNTHPTGQFLLHGPDDKSLARPRDVMD